MITMVGEGDSSHKQNFNRIALSQQSTFDMFRRNPTVRDPPKFVFCGVKFSGRELPSLAFVFSFPLIILHKYEIYNQKTLALSTLFDL